MRLSTRLLALPLVAAALVGTHVPTATAETHDTARVTPAVTWLKAQNSASGMLESFAGTPDPGLTLDAALASIAASGPNATASGWVRAAEKGFAARVVYDPGSGTTRDTGLIAKALVAVDAVGGRAGTYDGLNLAALTTEALKLGAKPGWFGAPNAPTSVNAFGQAYGMLGLARVSSLPKVTVDFLAANQCADGGFPMYFPKASSCNSDPDGTAMLVMALRAAKNDGIAAADAPLTKAVTWLGSKQRPNGSFLGAVPYTAVENANTTGLVTAALADLKPDVVAKARAWLSTMQLANGAIAYDAKLKSAGLTDRNKGTWIRSTAQGVFGFAPVTFHNLARTAPYTLAGEHTINGRQWRTTCSPYSVTERCRTEIWATVVVPDGAGFRVQNGWAFNNLTYLKSPERLWKTNPLGFAGEWTAKDGRKWRTICKTPETGRDGCRSYAEATVVSAIPKASGGYTFTSSKQWLFNNMVIFGG